MRYSTQQTSHPVERGQVHELLVVTNETLAGDAMIAAVHDLVAPEASVYVVSPTLVSRARLWTSDLTAGMVAARLRLRTSLACMRASGLHAEGVVGDTDPVQAIEDALRFFDAEHVLICMHPAAQSTRAERRLLERARARFSLPISHVIVDLEADARIAANARPPFRRALAE
jgi:GABA permease